MLIRIGDYIINMNEVLMIQIVSLGDNNEIGITFKNNEIKRLQFVNTKERDRAFDGIIDGIWYKVR